MASRGSSNPVRQKNQVSSKGLPLAAMKEKEAGWRTSTKIQRPQTGQVSLPLKEPEVKRAAPKSIPPRLLHSSHRPVISSKPSVTAPVPAVSRKRATWGPGVSFKLPTKSAGIIYIRSLYGSVASAQKSPPRSPAPPPELRTRADKALWRLLTLITRKRALDGAGQSVVDELLDALQEEQEGKGEAMEELERWLLEAWEVEKVARAMLKKAGASLAVLQRKEGQASQEQIAAAERETGLLSQVKQLEMELTGVYQLLASERDARPAAELAPESSRVREAEFAKSQAETRLHDMTRLYKDECNRSQTLEAELNKVNGCNLVPEETLLQQAGASQDYDAGEDPGVTSSTPAATSCSSSAPWSTHSTPANGSDTCDTSFGGGICPVAEALTSARSAPVPTPLRVDNIDVTEAAPAAEFSFGVSGDMPDSTSSTPTTSPKTVLRDGWGKGSDWVVKHDSPATASISKTAGSKSDVSEASGLITPQADLLGSGLQSHPGHAPASHNIGSPQSVLSPTPAICSWSLGRGFMGADSPMKE